MAFLCIRSQIACLSDSGSDSGHFRSGFLLRTSYCNERCWHSCVIKVNLVHAQAIVSLYFCNKPIRPIVATPHTTQINGSRDQIFKVDLFLVQALRICNHTRACNSWSCVYMMIHTLICQDMHVFMCVVLRVFHKPQACHMRVFCMTRLCAFKLRVTCTVYCYRTQLVMKSVICQMWFGTVFHT